MIFWYFITVLAAFWMPPIIGWPIIIFSTLAIINANPGPDD